MMKFNNKLELRYSFNDKSGYMDAVIRHRCEKEVLFMVRMLANMLDVKMTVYSEPTASSEGFKEIWPVAGESIRSISIVLNLFMQVFTSPSLLVGGKPVIERSAEDEQQLQHELTLLRVGLKQKAPNALISADLVKLLRAVPAFCKYKSNFYDTLRGYPKVTKITFRELNDSNRSRSGSLEVRREKFEYYILRSDDLPMLKDNTATIQIVSPVLTDNRYRWKGIYNKGGETIDFYMNDEEFKKQMVDEKIPFSSGMCIDCELLIERRLNEMGEIVNMSYTVQTVIRTRFDKLEVLTPQGKRYLRKIEAEHQQLAFDFFGPDK